MSLRRTGPSAPPIEGRADANPLLHRYSRDDLAVFTDEERRRLHIDMDADPRRDPVVAWELLYRLEPALYDRLVNAERLHPGILDWLPRHVDRIVEVAAGTGRLTLELVKRCHTLIAIEPAATLRELLTRKLDHATQASSFGDAQRRAPVSSIRVTEGFFDALPVADRSADVVIACSALTPEASQGGDRGLVEMERVCARPGMVVIVWPNHPDWLARHGYRHLAFPGEMAMEFASLEEAIELASIFYPDSVDEVRRRANSRVPYKVLGVNPPRDLAYKAMA